MPDKAAYFLLIAPTAMDASSTQVFRTQQKFRLISVISLLSKPDISYVIESMSKTTRLIDRGNSHAAAKSPHGGRSALVTGRGAGVGCQLVMSAL